MKLDSRQFAHEFARDIAIFLTESLGTLHEALSEHLWNQSMDEANANTLREAGLRQLSRQEMKSAVDWGKASAHLASPAGAWQGENQ